MTDDQEIDGFIPLSGDLRGLGRSLTGGGHKTSRGKSASGTKEMTTRKFHIFLLSLNGFVQAVFTRGLKPTIQLYYFRLIYKP